MSGHFAARNSSPPKSDAVKPRKAKNASLFRKLYQRGDFPVGLNYSSRSKAIKWKVDIKELDLNYYLPLFCTGLSETQDPYTFLVKQGIREMLQNARLDLIIAVVPKLILPIKNALETRDHQVVCAASLVIQDLVLCGEGVGLALVPYYRQLLPVMNMFKNSKVTVVYDHQRKLALGDLIRDTLEKMEMTGGEEAYVGIKYVIPTYRSCLVKS